MKKLFFILLLVFSLTGYSEDKFTRYHMGSVEIPDVNKSALFLKVPWLPEVPVILTPNHCLVCKDEEQEKKRYSYIEVWEMYIKYVNEKDPLQRQLKIRVIGLPYYKKELPKKVNYIPRGAAEPFIKLIGELLFPYNFDYDVYYKNDEVVFKIKNGLDPKVVIAFQDKAKTGFLTYKDFLSKGDKPYYESKDKSIIIYGRR
ncbi:MAG: hypothetical protein A2017_05570 [Lentisphaerae bacterium GWF2_44_16]|nr:MAG: hypothetical protein A2017_05570 [Lentisphaerae bacterium GWF2_44_16]